MPAISAVKLLGLGVLLALSPQAAAPASAAPPVGSHAIAAFPEAQSIGDFNGDGFDDLADRNGRVVFGAADLSRTAGATFDVPLANRGGVQALGDIDGDGFDDVSFAALPQGASTAASALVVYGASGTSPVPLAQGPRVGVVRTGPQGLATAPQGIGDFNGDGFDDFAIYRRDKSDYDPSMRGGYTVVLGGPRLASIDANVAGSRTVLLNGTTTCSVVTVFFIPIGYRCKDNSAGLLPAGDVDGDGKDDLVYGTTSPSTRGLIFGRAGSGATMRLTAPTAPAALFDGDPKSGLPHAAGDVDGDGKDDLMRVCSAATTDVALYRGRTVSAGAPFSLAAPTWTFSGRAFCDEVVAVGDIDGDGGDDLVAQQVARRSVAEGLTSYEVSLLSGLRALPDGATRALSSFPLLAGVPQVWANGLRPAVRAAAGDLDGDERDELLLADDEQQRILIASHGADRLAPEIPTRIVDPSSLERGAAAKVSPTGFLPGPAAAAVSLVLDGPATVRFTVKRGSATVGSFERSLPVGPSEAPWDGKIDGAALTDGAYTLELTPRDQAGNEGITRTVPFTVGGSGPAPTSATVALTAELLAPDGSRYPGELAWGAQCPDLASATQTSGGAAITLGGGSRFAGQDCILSIGGYQLVGGLEQCTWVTKIAINDGAPVDAATTGGTASFKLRPGANTARATVQCVGGRVITTGRPERFESPRWLKYGSARHQGTAVTLTTAGANQSGAVVWPEAFDPSGLTFSFYATMSGGNSTAEGLALAFLPATGPLPPMTAPFGPPGATLGLGTQPFTAVTLDSFKQPSDPAAAFIGLATGSSAGNLTYVQSADPGIRLRTANLWVSVTYKGGVLTVLINGKQRLQRTIALPSRAYLAFSAATNATGWQQHLVHGFNVVPAA